VLAEVGVEADELAPLRSVETLLRQVVQREDRGVPRSRIPSTWASPPILSSAATYAVLVFQAMSISPLSSASTCRS
jgi:hypothetical protein